MTAAGAGPSIEHPVLTVRDIAASHRFFTEVLGFEQCGTFESELEAAYCRHNPARQQPLLGEPSLY